MYLKNLMDKRPKQISFHMPGHKENYKFFEKNLVHYDLTEFDNFDNLSNPNEVIKKSIERIQRIFKSEKSHILVNGSTVGILATLFYINSLGGEILAYRNSHKSFFNAVTLTGQKVNYFNHIINDNKYYFNLNFDEIEKNIAENKDLKAFYITSPTYEGVCFDIEKISQICKKNNILLIVDEAHGAHFPLSNNFPDSSIKYADIVINSLHKTLPALTQTALIHCKNEHYNEVVKYINMLQTSSPSYLFMYSIDKLMEDIENNKLNYDDYFNVIDNFRLKFKDFRNLYLLDNQNIDKTRLTIFSNKCSGQFISNSLKEDNIFVEMYLDNYAILISTICDKKEDFDKLYESMQKLDEKLNKFNENIDKENKTVYNYIETLNNESKYTLKEAFSMNSISLELSMCENLVSKDYLIPYPPGIPIILPGEVITEKVISFICEAISQNIEVIGVNNGKINVIKGDDFYTV